jgi:hypothetical protein
MAKQKKALGVLKTGGVHRGVRAPIIDTLMLPLVRSRRANLRKHVHFVVCVSFAVRGLSIGKFLCWVLDGSRSDPILFLPCTWVPEAVVLITYRAPRYLGCSAASSRPTALSCPESQSVVMLVSAFRILMALW